MINKRYIVYIVCSIFLKGMLLFMYVNKEAVAFDNSVSNYLIILLLLSLVGYVDVDLGFQTAKL